VLAGWATAWANQGDVRVVLQALEKRDEQGILRLDLNERAFIRFWTDRNAV
jgi:hypothetical protein